MPGGLPPFFYLASCHGNQPFRGDEAGNLGLACARLGEVGKAIALLEGALQIGQEIKDPRMVDFFSAKLEELRGSE